MKANEKISLFNEVTIEESATVSGGNATSDIAFERALLSATTQTTTSSNQAPNPTNPSPTPSPSSLSLILPVLAANSGGVAGGALVTGS